jgi:hypothetical protein
MTCRLCSSENQREFVSEMVIHFSGLQNMKKPKVLAFPKLRVCMDCGFTESTMRETELRLLGKHAAEQVTAASLSQGWRFELSELIAGLPFGTDEVGAR